MIVFPKLRAVRESSFGDKCCIYIYIYIYICVCVCVCIKCFILAIECLGYSWLNCVCVCVFYVTYIKDVGSGFRDVYNI